jgi:hypothetical protein
VLLFSGHLHNSALPLLSDLQVVVSGLSCAPFYIAGCGNLLPAHLFDVPFHSSGGFCPVPPRVRKGAITALATVVGAAGETVVARRIAVCAKTT